MEEADVIALLKKYLKIEIDVGYGADYISVASVLSIDDSTGDYSGEISRSVKYIQNQTILDMIST